MDKILTEFGYNDFMNTKIEIKDELEDVLDSDELEPTHSIFANVPVIKSEPETSLEQTSEPESILGPFWPIDANIPDVKQESVTEEILDPILHVSVNDEDVKKEPISEPSDIPTSNLRLMIQKRFKEKLCVAKAKRIPTKFLQKLMNNEDIFEPILGVDVSVKECKPEKLPKVPRYKKPVNRRRNNKMETYTFWTKERKEEHSQRMRDYWANVKIQNCQDQKPQS